MKKTINQIRDENKSFVISERKGVEQPQTKTSPLPDSGIAEVKNINLDTTTREIKVTIAAIGTIYVEEPKQYGFPMLMNSAPLVEGFNYVLEFGHEAVNAMKGNKEFKVLAEQNRILRQSILDSDLAARCRQFLSSIDYEQLTDYSAKCALLLEKELSSTN